MKMEAEHNVRSASHTVVIDAVIIASIWCICIFMINPFGNFPLNDDWSFGMAVYHFIEKGEFRPTGWTSMPLVTQTLWGALFCIPSGFSFNALRLSTLTLSLMGMLGIYWQLIELNRSRYTACFVSLVIGFSPMYLALSHTFMTDVPYTALTVFASICFIRSLKSDSLLALMMGTALAIAATLTRQLALSLPLAFAVSFVLIRGVTFRTLVRAAISPILCIAVLLVFQYWLSGMGRLPVLYNDFSDNLLKAFTKPETVWLFMENAYVAFCYLGFFLLPVSLVVVGGLWDTDSRRILKYFGYSAGLVTVGAAAIWSVSGMDYILLPGTSRFGIGNIIVKSGIGPLTLPGTEFFSLPELSSGFWLLVTVLGAFGAVLLITVLFLQAVSLISKLRSGGVDAAEAAVVFLMGSVLIYLLPLFMVGFYDRYLMPVIPILAVIIAHLSSCNPRAINKVFLLSSMAVIIALSFFAVCGTRDYLEWNRVRWGALHDLMRSTKARAENIDGGFEFNGWHLYGINNKEDPNKSWWWVRDDTYKLGFGPLPGYRVVGEYNYNPWLFTYAGKIVVQKRIQESTSSK